MGQEGQGNSRVLVEVLERQSERDNGELHKVEKMSCTIQNVVSSEEVIEILLRRFQKNLIYLNEKF